MKLCPASIITNEVPTEVWPGDSVFVDYTLPDARRWWGDLHRAYLDQGVAGSPAFPPGRHGCCRPGRRGVPVVAGIDLADAQPSVDVEDALNDRRQAGRCSVPGA